MTSHSEQLFFFGRIVEPEPLTGPSLLILADLTAESAIVIGTMTLVALIMGFWDTFVSWTNSSVNLILLPILHILHSILRFSLQLLMIRSSYEFRRHIRWDRVTSTFVSLRNSRGGRLARSIWRWYFPDNKPVRTTCRLLTTLVICCSVYKSTLRPLHWYLSGFLDGLITNGAAQSVYCMDAITRLHQNHRMSTRKWMQSQYCIGQEDGLNIRSTFDGYTWSDDMFNAEIDSFRLLAYIAILLCTAVHIGLGVWFISGSATYQQVATLWAARNTVHATDTPLESPIGGQEAEIWQNVFRMYEARFTTMKQLLLTKNKELQEANQHIQQSRCAIERLSAPPTAEHINPKPPAEPRVIVQLRQEIASKDTELEVIRSRLTRKDNKPTAKERTLAAVILRLQTEAVQKDREVFMAQERLRKQEADNANRGQTIANEVISLEQQLTDRVTHEAALQAEIENHRNEVASQKDTIGEMKERLADAEAKLKHAEEQTQARDIERAQEAVQQRELSNQAKASTPTLTPVDKELTDRHHALMTQYKGLSKQHDDLIARLQEQVFQNRDLALQNMELSRRRDDIQAMGDQVVQQLAITERERDAALGQVAFLQQELNTTRAQAKRELQESKRSLEMAQANEAGLRETMQSLKAACDGALEQQRVQAEQRVRVLTTEMNDLQTKIGLAMRDAQRSHEQARQEADTNRILQHRLSKWERSDSLQEIPKRSTGKSGSIVTAFEQSQVTISEQTMKIKRLEGIIAEMQGRGSTTDSGWPEKFQVMRQALEAEQRAHKEAVVHLGRKNKELAEEVQKLRISLSNAKAMVGGKSPLRSPMR